MTDELTTKTDALAARIDQAETLLSLAEIERDVRTTITGSNADDEHARAWLFARSSQRASAIARGTIDRLLAEDAARSTEGE